MKQHQVYIAIIGVVFLAFAVVFDTFPRSEVSELEKRELKQFPEFSWERLADGSFTRDVSSWFSDSEPFRDQLMELSMYIKHLTASPAIGDDEEAVRFHASDDAQPADDEQEQGEKTADINLADSLNNDFIEENAKIANKGIIIVGTGANVRALMAYGGSAKGGVSYAEAANKYKEVFGDKVNVYCMVIPTSTEFYCPEKAKKCTNPQLPTIKNIFAHLAPGVKPVNIYNTLAEHKQEDIYLRTDHHWSPLGGYYAAQEFARVAGVPFQDLSHYERRVTHGYVGSMYGYSKDISVKNAPEDFVYYVPQGVDYETTYINYNINKNYQVTGEGRPYKAAFFFKFKDGSGGAYCTMMGGDTKLTQVRTSTKNGRRVIILKDSFGNMLPSYLFFSFEEVHVIDSRYFTKNMKDYVTEHKITDILFANNIFKAYSDGTYKMYLRFLTQRAGTHAAPDAPTKKPDAPTKKPDATQPTEPETTPKPDAPTTPDTPKEPEAPKPAPAAPQEQAAPAAASEES
ncbi:MAG: hypothetical protein IJ527_08075 [Prevotella sp.]|nr:hypothetical protein [Prevotella sp.]